MERTDSITAIPTIGISENHNATDGLVSKCSASVSPPRSKPSMCWMIAASPRSSSGFEDSNARLTAHHRPWRPHPVGGYGVRSRPIGAARTAVGSCDSRIYDRTPRRWSGCGCNVLRRSHTGTHRNRQFSTAHRWRDSRGRTSGYERAGTTGIRVCATTRLSKTGRSAKSRNAEN